ncbi:MAG: hypothetical protein Altm1KO_19480 [Alteromonas macleodii]
MLPPYLRLRLNLALHACLKAQKNKILAHKAKKMEGLVLNLYLLKSALREYKYIKNGAVL